MLKRKSTISVAIATYNEESNVDRCLNAVKDWVDEIVIVDGHSSDDTVKLIKKYKNIRLIETDNKPIFHLNKQMAIDACTSDWILQLDADEVVTEALKSEIEALLETEPDKVKENGFWIKRKNYFLGKFLKKGGVYPDPTLRLYKKNKGRLPCKDVHEQAVVGGAVGWLNSDLEHFADPLFSRYLLRSNRYTSIEAQQLKDSGQELSFFSYFLTKPLLRFIQMYFRHRGYVDGFPGFVFAFFSSLRFPIVYVKFYELKNNQRKINTKEDWD